MYRLYQPISACWADSPHFRYYGEVDAKNKFLGRSFEIRPTGDAHVDLRIPSAWAKGNKDYPEDTTYKNLGEDGVLEHYRSVRPLPSHSMLVLTPLLFNLNSWKKVTTAVSNFIMGNPIIDH